jgi:hypothetical protein
MIFGVLLQMVRCGEREKKNLENKNWKIMQDEIEINGEIYVKKTPCSSNAAKKYCLVRTYSAGVFAGYIESENGQEVVLTDARRIWCWSGAASLSELAMKGTSKPDECKFPVPVSRVVLKECTEILDVTDQAKQSIQNVPVWTAHE